MLQLSNEQIVKLIKSGQTQLYDDLYQQNKRFIHMIAKRYSGYADIEDLEQECFLALYDAIEKFEPDRGYKFLSYCAWWLKQRCTRYIQYKKSLLLTCMSLEDSVYSEDNKVSIKDTLVSGVDVENAALDDLERREIWHTCDRLLTSEEYRVIHMKYAQDMTIKDIATLYGSTYNEVRNIQKKALDKLYRNASIREKKEYLIAKLYNHGTEWDSITERTALKLYNLD